MSSAVLNLITGVNGSGKTLFLLDRVEAYRKAENTGNHKDGKPRHRPLYYWGIRGIKEQGILTEWNEIETFDPDGKILGMEKPSAVHDLPVGSIIVIDEAHAAFPRTAMVTVEKDGRKEQRPAPHIESFATSRWRGHTFFFITQYGKDVHPFIRERIGKYWHVRRNWGMERSVVYEWEEFVDSKSTAARKNSTVIQYPYNKAVYGWYKSADQHNIKKTVPWHRLALVPLGLIAAGVMTWYAFHRLSPPGAKTDKAKSTQTDKPTTTPVADPVHDGSRWASQFTERVKGQPYSAKFYDASLKAATIPKISGCMHVVMTQAGTINDKCICNTQQGTTITTMTHADCLYYVANGWFDPTKSDRDEADSRPSGQSPSLTAPAISTAALGGG